MSSETQTTEARLATALSSPKQRKFVIAYVENGGNGTAAAEIAGFAHPAQEASRLLKNDKVIAAIDAHAGKVTRVAGETRDTVLDRIRNRANGNMADFYKLVPLFDNEGQPMLNRATGEQIMVQELKRVDELTREQAACIKKVTLNQHGYTFELHDQGSADRDLARLMGLEPKESGPLTAEGAAAMISAAMNAMEQVGGA